MADHRHPIQNAWLCQPRDMGSDSAGPRNNASLLLQRQLADSILIGDFSQRLKCLDIRQLSISLVLVSSVQLCGLVGKAGWCGSPLISFGTMRRQGSWLAVGLD